MTASLATKQVMDGAGTIFLQRVLDVSGTGAGPFLPLAGISAPDGSGPVDIGTLLDALTTAVQSQVSLAAGTAVIGKIGLQTGGSDVAAANPLSTSLAGVGYQSTGLTPVAGTVSAAGTTAALAVKAGRTAYLWLSGGTSASGYFEYSNDAGSTWFASTIEGSQIGTFSYVAATFNQVIPVLVPDQAGITTRVRFAAVSGTVTYTLSQ